MQIKSVDKSRDIVGSCIILNYCWGLFAYQRASQNKQVKFTLPTLIVQTMIDYWQIKLSIYIIKRDRTGEVENKYIM